MKKCLALGFLFLTVACSDGSDHSEIATSSIISESESFYQRLIELIGTASKNGEMSDELMQEIFFVYSGKLLSNSGPNVLNPFMECVKVHQDLLRIIKKAPADVVRDFRDLQNEFLRELQMMKKCKMNEYRDCITASRMVEGAYLQFLLFHFSRNKDFYDKRIAEAIRNESFSTAISAALHLKVFGTSHQRLIEAREVRFLTKNPGKILQLLLTECCGSVSMKFSYVDERGEIHQTFFPQQCQNKCILTDHLPEIVIAAVGDRKFFKWYENKSIAELFTYCQDKMENVYFKFDAKTMKWTEVKRPF